jgi:Mrp family chromosome partitioning ATPase/capsular polysaccharide biosynthesis protein
VILLAVAITTASAALFASRQTTLYEASAQVFVNPNAQGASGGGTAADVQSRFLSTDAQLVHTPAVAAAAIHQSGVSSISEGRLLADSTVAADASTNILTVRVSEADPNIARVLANSYANAIADQTKLLAAESVQGAIDHLRSSIAAVNRQITAARKAGSDATSLHQRLNLYLRQLDIEQQLQLTQPVVAKVSLPAQRASQTQPKTPRTIGIGLFLGLALGCTFAFLREAFDTRIRSAGEVEEMLHLNLLARIPAPPRKLSSENRLAMLADSTGESAESYRKLRVALDFANLNVRARTVMVTSAVEEEGKSTTVANLAVAIAQTGRKVILVDLDLRRPSIDRTFDLRGRVGITDVALGHATLTDALATVALTSARESHPESTEAHPGGANGDGVSRLEGILEVLPAGALPPNPAELSEAPVMASLLQDLAGRADIVLIDSAPLLPVADAVALSTNVDGMLIVAHTDILRRPAVAEMARVLETCRAAKLGFVLTGTPTGEDAYRYGYGTHVRDSQDAATAPPSGSVSKLRGQTV